MFIYDHRSPIDAAKDQIHPMQQLYFPFMNFTCDGSITRLMFVARNRSRDVVTAWPTFSLWEDDGIIFREVINSMGPLPPSQITSLQPPSRSSVGDKQVEVVVINFTVPVSFVAGNLLGLRQTQGYDWQHSTNTGTFMPQISSIRVLRQNGGGLVMICDEWNSVVGECVGSMREVQEMPYIAIETSKFCK